MFKQSDSDSHGEESWVSCESWIGWNEAEDSWTAKRPGVSKGRMTEMSKGVSTRKLHEPGLEEHIPGKVQEPGREEKNESGHEGFLLGMNLSACGRLASNQLVHACAGNPVPFSKVPGQVLQAGNFIEQATLEQGDLEDWLSTERGRA